MKNLGSTSHAEAVSPQGLPPGGDGRTRESVARTVLEHGPISAAEVADSLGLSPAAVRRHLDALLAGGQASTRSDPRRGRRGRGRPAKLFLLTEAGRARFGHAYDDLAVAALRFVAESGGEQAVRSFAERRVADMIDRYRATVTAQPGTAGRAEALAVALSAQGYAASTQHAGVGAQLCQHHCPVAHVAAEFPQLCEAETAAFAEVLGTHVQRLATIARGDAVCTTHVPSEARAEGPGEAGAGKTGPGEAGAEQHDSSPTEPTTDPDGGVSA
ncbi:MAG: winged helix-turn-helix transcriptional regulator [Pseudonocardiaceae bacterium]|nr:winged helix-turn-helix transcriptional regulator [Pseudonocardiaceae bacterium]